MSSNEESVRRAFENGAEQRREKIRAHVKQILQKAAGQYMNDRRDDLSGDRTKSDDSPGA